MRKGPVAKKLLARSLVGFQTESGEIAVLDGRCSHLGAELGRGSVVGETIRCPFHHWQYGCDGECVKTNGQDGIPQFARQRSYPTKVRHGHVYFFFGTVPLFPLPFFDDENSNRFIAGKPFPGQAGAAWYMMAAQGFDRQHFEAVHDRKLLSPPVTDSPSRFARRNRWPAEIVGTSMRDRLLRIWVGRTVRLSISNWGGTVFTVKAEFPRACSRFLVFCRPLEKQQTHFDVIVFAPRGTSRLGLALRRQLTRGHILNEAGLIQNTRYQPDRLVGSDSDMIGCFRWLASISQTSAADQPEKTHP